MPKGFTDREKAIIRAGMYEKGRDLFATYGLRKTSVEDLTNAVGISKGAFYLFFESKEQLFYELMEQFRSDFQTMLFRHINVTSESPRVRMRKLLAEAVSLWKRNAHFVHLSTDDYEHLLRKLPFELLDLHKKKDNAFAIEFASAWHNTGVNLRHEPPMIAALLRALFFVSLHEEDFGSEVYPQVISTHIEMLTQELLPKG